ncbi:MAG TPA: hypothetical protein VHH92_01675 [Actinomycetota bacterium]|nr:hypothetical protein [Actinomycetota bacterium]
MTVWPAMRQRAHAPPGGIRSTAVFATVVAVFAVASFPGDYRPISTGLDPSWIFAINHLPHTEVRFGADVVFSYGPLGYLLTPVDIGTNLVQAAVSWLLIQAATVLAMVHHYRRTERLDAVLLFAVAVLVALSFALPYEYRPLLVLGLLLSVDPDDRAAWRIAWPAAALLAAVLVYTKMTAAVAASAMLLGAGIVRLVQRRIAWTGTAIGLGSFLAAVLALGIGLTGGPGELARWVRGSLEVASGFAEAMSVPQPAGLLWPGIAATVIAAATLVLVVRRSPATMAVAVAVGLMALLAFRHGYVRHHGRLVYAVLLVALAVVGLTVRGRREVGMLAGGCVAVTVLAVAAYLTPGCLCTWRAQALGPEGVGNLIRLVTLPATEERVQRRTERLLRRDRLPSDVVVEVRASGRGTDVVPEEISFIPANDLAWVPNPTIQSYATYTPYLDRWAAGHFAADGAPATILIEFVDIDGRHAMFAAPRMWRAILSHYEPVAQATGRFGEVTLLARTNPRPFDLRSVGGVTARVGEWVSVPSADGIIFADIHLEPTVLGRLARLAWRVDPVLLDVRFETGAVATFRLVPRTAEGGLLISPLPTSGAQLRGLWRGQAPPAVRAIRVHGPGAGSFDPSVRIAWRAGDGLDSADPGAP